MTGEIIFDGTSMLSLSESQLKKYRGKDIAMVMQQGSRAFDPSTTVGKQMFEDYESTYVNVYTRN